jgi:exodeoxyribonuclease V beta subunit
MDRSIREWRFTMPMAGLSVQTMARVFRDHGGMPWLSVDYADRLARASASGMDGYMTGIIDLVAQIDGRWWIIDWKTNTLGSTPAAYDEEGCRVAMMREHYVLQYHLYVVALHRHLRARMGAAYAYESHMGGVAYAFLRGLAADMPAWFVDRPSRERIDALDRIVGGVER